MDTVKVLEYKCPCCNAGLKFEPGIQQLTCEYCDNTFDLETLELCNESAYQESAETLTWDDSQQVQWSPAEQASMQYFQCPACGAEIVTEETTAASFCPYCDNPTVLPGRVSGGLKPDAILPFSKTKEDAQQAFLRLCKSKPLLPKEFTSKQRLERITGVYVPFWLYDCEGHMTGSYRATKVTNWSDSQYSYTKTDHFLLKRKANAAFRGIPMDASSKMDDTFMESIEPFDLNQMKAFDMAYLTGFLADKYDVPSENGEDRIRQRVDASIKDNLQSTFLGYTTVTPTTRVMDVTHSRARYSLLPVWLLNTNYNGKTYTFAMNGQTGKMTGEFPVSAGQSAKWFCIVSVAVAVAVTLLQLLL